MSRCLPVLKWQGMPTQNRAPGAKRALPEIVVGSAVETLEHPSSPDACQSRDPGTANAFGATWKKTPRWRTKRGAMKHTPYQYIRGQGDMGTSAAN
jgi:hypothetical protein